MNVNMPVSGPVWPIKVMVKTVMIPIRGIVQDIVMSVVMDVVMNVVMLDRWVNLNADPTAAV